METLRQLATFDDDGYSLYVRFNYGVVPTLDREGLHRLLTVVAAARLIRFFDPTGKQVGEASSLRGIRVFE